MLDYEAYTNTCEEICLGYYKQGNQVNLWYKHKCIFLCPSYICVCMCVCEREREKERERERERES